MWGIVSNRKGGTFVIPQGRNVTFTDGAERRRTRRKGQYVHGRDARRDRWSMTDGRGRGRTGLDRRKETWTDRMDISCPALENERKADADSYMALMRL